MDVDQRIFYTHGIFKGSALNKYREVLATCRQSANELAGDEWNLRELVGLFADDFLTWEKLDTTGYDVHAYLRRDKCVNFER